MKTRQYWFHMHYFDIFTDLNISLARLRSKELQLYNIESNLQETLWIAYLEKEATLLILLHNLENRMFFFSRTIGIGFQGYLIVNRKPQVLPSGKKGIESFSTSIRYMGVV